MPGPVAGTGIENDDRRLSGAQAILQAIVANPRDPQERVVGRALEAASVENDLVIEVEEGRLARALVRQHVVGPLPQRVPK
jgi:hypothetical protein